MHKSTLQLLATDANPVIAATARDRLAILRATSSETAPFTDSCPEEDEQPFDDDSVYEKASADEYSAEGEYLEPLVLPVSSPEQAVEPAPEDRHEASDELLAEEQSGTEQPAKEAAELDFTDESPLSVAAEPAPGDEDDTQAGSHAPPLNSWGF
ncbi:hypothetical protein ACXR2T_07735 [Leucobacter sp. HY1910]